MSETSPQPIQDKNRTVCIEHEKLKLHFAYLVVILVFAMILLATGQFTPKEKFTEYLSNAATLVSVVLGLVAIFYSFVSNDSLSKSLGSISNVTEQIGQTREQMAVYVERTTDIATSSTEGAVIMKDASLEMKSSFQELNNLLSVMHGQTSEFKEVLNQLPVRFDKLEAAIQDKKENEVKRQSMFINNTLPDENVKTFINHSSLSTNLLCYAMSLAIKTKKKLIVKEYCELVGTKLTGQIIGILRTMDAINLVDLVEIESFTYDIVEVHRVIKSEIENYFKDYIAANFSDRPESMTLWNNRIKSVETAYGNMHL